jgi:integrase
MPRARRGRNEGSIFQRESDGRWVGSISLGFSGERKRRRKTIYGESKKEVQDKIRELQNSAAAGRLPTGGAMSVADYFRVWLDGIKASIEPTTWALYDGHFRNHISPRLGGSKLADLRAIQVVNLYAEMIRDGVSASTARKVGVTLNVGLDAAVMMSLTAYNVAASVPKPKPAHTEVRVFTPEQVSAFLSEAAGDRLCALYAAAIDSGCRQGELFALRWNDFDAASGTFTITKAMAELNGKVWVKDVKTKNGRRRVQLGYCLDELEKHRERMELEGQDTRVGLIFPDTEGNPLRKSNFWRRSFVPILKRAGLPASTRFHDLRHGCASLLLLAGTDVKVVSERLGHASAAFTMSTYQHVLPGLQQDAADRLRGVLTPKPKLASREAG